MSAVSVPVDLLFDEEIPRSRRKSALWMYTTIARIQDEHGEAVMTLDQLNETAEVSLKTGLEAVNVLIESGWVSRQARRVGKRNLPSRYVAHVSKQTTRAAA